MKKIIFVFSFLIFSLIIGVSSTKAVDLWGEEGGVKEEARNILGYDSNYQDDPRLVAANVIQIGLTFLGIIAVAIIIWGGWTYMTAGGNEDDVAEGLKIIKSGIIGLVIILGAWALASWSIDTINQDILGNQ